MPDTETGAEGAGTEKVDLDAAISSALDGAENDTEAEQEHARDDKGRFAKADTDQTEQPEAQASDKPPTDGQAEPEAGDEGQAEASAKASDEGAQEPEQLEAPGHWPREDREAFSNFDRATQELLIKRDKLWEGQATRKSQDLSDKAKFADDVQGLFDEATRNQMALSGMDERAALRQLVAAHQFATRDPVGYIQWFAQRAGINPGQLAPQGEGQGGDPAEDLDPSMQPLVSRLNGVEQFLQQFVQSQQQTQQSALEQTVTAFRDAKADDGTQLHPHFEKLKVRMGALMQHDPTLKAMPDGPDKLKTAYDMVLYTDPELRTETLEREKSKALEAERKKSEAEKAKRAKAPQGTASSGQGAQKSTSLDDIIAEEMDARA